MNKLPEHIGGYQHVVNGPTMDGDIWVHQGAPMTYVNTIVDRDVEEANARYPSWGIYRLMPQPGHIQPEVVEALREAGREPAGALSSGQYNPAGAGANLQERVMAKAAEVEDRIIAGISKTILERHGIIDTKPTNPKDLIGSDKLPLHLWPTTASSLGCLALLDGMLKYGRSNFRAVGVRASIYYDACNRHLNAWFEGEDDDPDSGLPHLAHALACLAVLVDAQAAGKMNDDRLLTAKYRRFVDDLTPHVKRLKAKHADRNPKHYTIADNPVARG